MKEKTRYLVIDPEKDSNDDRTAEKKLTDVRDKEMTQSFKEMKRNELSSGHFSEQSELS